MTVSKLWKLVADEEPQLGHAARPRRCGSPRRQREGNQREAIRRKRGGVIHELSCEGEALIGIDRGSGPTGSMRSPQHGQIRSYDWDIAGGLGCRQTAQQRRPRAVRDTVRVYRHADGRQKKP
jgi:hypothetical protein